MTQNGPGAAPAVSTRALPGNPNCVSFAARASDVLTPRSWGRVLELAEAVLSSFHEVSGLTVVAGFGARVALDRRNRRQSQVTMYLLMDGPATAAHMDHLDRTVAHNPIRWSVATIERLPVNGVHCLCAHEGVVSLVVSGPEGEPTVPWLALRDGAVRGEEVPLSSVVDQLGERFATTPRIRLGPPSYGDAERETERMRLAFAQAFAQRIIEADGIIQDDEEAFMASVFSPGTMARLGLSDASVRDEYFEASLRELPGRLGHHDKLALVGLFFTACYSDGSLDAREMRVLKDAADALGVERARVVKYLQRFW